MKYFYIAVQQKIETGFYAYVIRVSTSDNLVHKLSHFYAANICDTKRRAHIIAAAWNNNFISSKECAFPVSDWDENEPLPF